MIRGAALLLTLVVVQALGADAFGAARLASYRAVYDLKLGSSESGSGIANLSGRLVLEWNDTCAGYLFAQRIRTEMTLMEGGPAVSDYTVNSWESRDGKKFRFSMKHVVNDDVLEVFQGKAELGAAPGEPGKVVYDRPEEKTETLPADVIFPTEHNRILVEKALAGENLVVVDVFDGSGDEGLNRATAFIGRERPEEPADEARYAPLKGLISWPVRLAFHRLAENKALPAYEIGFRLYQNGVPGDVVLVYDDFSISGRLSVLEILPDPDC